MNIQLDLIDLIQKIEFELNSKLHSLAVETHLKWHQLLVHMKSDYAYQVLTKMYQRTVRRFEKLVLVGGL